MTTHSINQFIIPLTQVDLKKIMRIKDMSINSFKLNFLNRIQFQLLGSIKVGTINQKEENIKPIYLFNCQRHGLQLTSPKGWSKKLLCDVCIRDLNEEQ